MSKTLVYSGMQIALHWGIAALIIYQFVYHEGIEEAYEQALETGVYAQSLGWASHAIPGILVLLLVIWRLVLRLRRGAPDAPAEEPAIFAWLSHLAHWAFYALMLALPITGMLAWGGQIEASAEVHEVLKSLLMLLVLVHVGAVLVHQFIWKTNIMQRMKRAG